MRLLVPLAALLCTLGCRSAPTAVLTSAEPVAISVTELPSIGSRPADTPSFSGSLAIAPSRMDSLYQVRFQGVLFDITVDRSGLTSYVSTSDESFSTPEGVRPGGALTDAMARAGANPILEPGWACHVRLPSGWHAAARLEGRQLDRCGESVAWVFQRS